MGTIAEKLQYTSDAIDDIQAAIISKGVSVSSSDALSTYGNKIRSIPTGGGSTPPNMTVVLGEVSSDPVSTSYTVTAAGLYFVGVQLGGTEGATAPSISCVGSYTEQYSYNSDSQYNYYAIKIYTCAVNDVISISYTPGSTALGNHYIVKIDGYTTIGTLLGKYDDYYELIAPIDSYLTHNKILVYLNGIGSDEASSYYLEDSNYNMVGTQGSINFLLCPMISYPTYIMVGDFCAGGLMVIDKDDASNIMLSFGGDACAGVIAAWEIS